MKKSFLLSFSFRQTTSSVVTETTTSEFVNKVCSKENDAKTLKYLASDELEGRETGKAGMGKSGGLFRAVFKDNNKALFQIVS
jgi:hypothetical protein